MSNRSKWNIHETRDFSVHLQRLLFLSFPWMGILIFVGNEKFINRQRSAHVWRHEGNYRAFGSRAKIIHQAVNYSFCERRFRLIWVESAAFDFKTQVQDRFGAEDRNKNIFKRKLLTGILTLCCDCCSRYTQKPIVYRNFERNFLRRK